MKQKLSNRDTVFTASLIGTAFIVFGFQNCAPQQADEPQKQNTQVIGNSSTDSSVPDPHEDSSNTTASTENRLKYTAETTFSSSGVPSLVLKSACSSKNSAITIGSTADSVTEFKELRNFTCTSVINRKYFAVSTIQIFKLEDGKTKTSQQLEIVSESRNARKVSIGKLVSGSDKITVSANIAANVDDCDNGTITTTSTCTENRKDCGTGQTLSANKSTCMASKIDCVTLPTNAKCTETYNPLTNNYGNKKVTCKTGYKSPSSDSTKCLQETWVSAVVDGTQKKPLYCLNNMALAQGYYRITKIDVIGKGPMYINPGTGFGFPHIAAIEGNKDDAGGFKITCTLK